jgi:hypothetical protein
MLLPAVPVLKVRGADEPQKSAAYVKVEIGGEFKIHRHVRYGHTAVGITMDNQVYWLDYNQYKGLQTVEGRKPFENKSVVVTGRLELRPSKVDDSGEKPDGMKREPVVVVATIKLQGEK